MAKPRRLDTRALGLDLGSELVRFATGRENLHYGYWHEGLEVCIGNLRQAQEAYTEKVKSFMPLRQLRVLDIGGGCGEFAKELVADGHEVEIVVPSATLAARCRENVGPSVQVHHKRFFEFRAAPRFDLCLFSESLQYMPPEEALHHARQCLAIDGEILVSDCFRSQEFYEEFRGAPLVGGGHSLELFREVLATGGYQTLREEDITESVAPSVDLEQQLYNFLGMSLKRIDEELSVIYPRRRKLLHFILYRLLSERRQTRLKRRLFGQYKNSSLFCRYNRYLILSLKA